VREELRRKAGEAWAFRTRVEREAARRFARLAAAIAAFDADSPVPALMRQAAEDERRHAALCADLSAVYGQPVGAAAEDAAIAPGSLGARAAVLYEVVASCCITETESVATLTTLLAEPVEPRVERVLREIARDEVVHGRLGWAYLSMEASISDVSFLSPWIPAMLAGTVGEGLFASAGADLESRELLRHGVLPHSLKRSIFIGTLEGVVFPGLEKFGISSLPARQWLSNPAARSQLG
jgi:rubrerythrin